MVSYADTSECKRCSVNWYILGRDIAAEPHLVPWGARLALRAGCTLCACAPLVALDTLVPCISPVSLRAFVPCRTLLARRAFIAVGPGEATWPPWADEDVDFGRATMLKAGADHAKGVLHVLELLHHRIDNGAD